MTCKDKYAVSAWGEVRFPTIIIIHSILFDGAVSPLKIDMSTGDVITPREVRYHFKLRLAERTIDVLAYNLKLFWQRNRRLSSLGRLPIPE